MILTKQLHYWLGLVGIIIFLLTGQYMYHAYSQLQGLEDGPRMLFGSAHICFLLTSIINLLMGVYLEPRSLPLDKIIQFIISIAILLAPAFLLVVFFLEHHLENLERPYSQLGIFTLFGVTIVVMVVSLKNKIKRE